MQYYLIHLSLWLDPKLCMIPSLNAVQVHLSQSVLGRSGVKCQSAVCSWSVRSYTVLFSFQTMSQRCSGKYF